MKARQSCDQAIACLIITAVLLLPGCDEQRSSEPAGNDTQPLRVVTLAPALSQMIVDLGAPDVLVGVAEHDYAAPSGLPIIGNFQNINLEMLIAVKPTHVLMMKSTAGTPPRLQQMFDSGQFELIVYPYPQNITDVCGILFAEASDHASPSIGRVIGREAKASRLSEQILAKLEAIGTLTKDRPRPAVLMAFNTEPVMASGVGTINDALLRYAGGINVAGDTMVTAPVFDRESLLMLNPEVILLLLPQAPALVDGDHRLAIFRDLNIPAVKNDRIALLNDPLVLLPSTNMPLTCGAMAKAIHPELADQIDRILEGKSIERVESSQ